jgi:hypothetical protein
VASAGALAAQVRARSPWHPELLLPKSVIAEGVQHAFKLPADVGTHPNGSLEQSPVQDFGKGGTEQEINTQLRHLVRKSLGFECIKEHLLATDLFPVAAGQNQQSCRRIQKRRNATLPNWNAEFHDSNDCKPHYGLPAQTEAGERLRFPESPEAS